MVGGGSTPAPGEISLAHHGVKWWSNLFLISEVNRPSPYLSAKCREGEYRHAVCGILRWRPQPTTCGEVERCNLNGYTTDHQSASATWG